jgi:hypothetical protein
MAAGEDASAAAAACFAVILTLKAFSYTVTDAILAHCSNKHAAASIQPALKQLNTLAYSSTIYARGSIGSSRPKPCF